MRRGLFLLLLLSAGSARAARLETSVEPREARVGDRVTLSVTLVPGPGESPLPFQPPADWGSFALVSAASSGTVHAFTLAVFEVDAATVPALAFRYLDARGAERSLSTPPIRVDVKSVLPPDASDIKDIKGRLRRAPVLWWPWLAAALGILAAVFSWRRFRRGGMAGSSPVPALPPDQEALEELDRLEALVTGPAKPFHSRLTDVFRRYVERRFGLPALDRTTAEMIPLLKELPLAPEERVVFRELLDTADLAKFARLETPPDLRRGHRDAVAAFVRATRPQAEAAT